MRPTDWAPLATEDPVPGDPEVVAAAAERHAALAALLEQQSAALRAMAAGEGWDADAGRAFGGSSRDLAGRLDRARRRYSVVAEELRRYAPRLRQAQAEADAARLQARVWQEVNTAPTPFPAQGQGPDTIQGCWPSHGHIAPEDNTHLARARAQLAEAVRARDEAALIAQRRIAEVLGSDGLEDGLWDHVTDHLGDTADWLLGVIHASAGWLRFIADAVGAIGTALTMVAIVLSFIPVVNAVSVVLFSVAAVLTAVGLICHLLLAVSGDGSWFDVGLDVFAIATFGYGKAAKPALEAARSTLRATTGASLTARIGRGMPRPRAYVTLLARAGLPRPVASSIARAGGSREAVDVLAKNQLPLWRRLMYGDGELARTMGERAGLTAAVTKRLGADAAEVAQAERASREVTRRVWTLAGLGHTGNVLDGLDASTSLTLPDGTTVDMPGMHKSSQLDPLKPRLTWGRYANAR